MAPTIIERQASLTDNQESLEKLLSAIPHTARKPAQRVESDGESFIEKVHRALDYYRDHLDEVSKTSWKVLLDYTQSYSLKQRLQEELKTIRVLWNQCRIQYLELKLENRYTLEHFKLDTPQKIQAKIKSLEGETREFSHQYQKKLLELDAQKQTVLKLQKQAEAVLHQLAYQ